MFPFIERIFADGGYAGQKMALVAWRTGTWRLQIVKRSDAAGFEVYPSDGSSNEHSPGSAATAVWLVTSNATQPQSSHSSDSP